MGNNQSEREYEEIRLKQTISLAEEQLKQAKEAAEKKKSQIIEAKKEVRENATHSVTNLYTSDGFEALVELSQYMNPVTDKIVDYEEEEHRILLLENMIHNIQERSKVIIRSIITINTVVYCKETNIFLWK